MSPEYVPFVIIAFVATLLDIVVNDKVCWFVLRVTYQRELIAKAMLDALGIESFIPTCSVRVKRLGKYINETKALIHNYIFVRATRRKIEELKRGKLSFLRYVMCNNEMGLRVAQTVPERQMNSFIAIAGNYEEQALFLNIDELKFVKGDRVRVLSGVFEGVEGVLVKLPRKRDKRVVVEISGVVAVATTAISPALVQKIDN